MICGRGFEFNERPSSDRATDEATDDEF